MESRRPKRRYRGAIPEFDGIKNLIYVLVDPRDGSFRYIGMSSQGMKRPRQHEYQATSGKKSHKCSWIRQLLSAGIEYETRLLEAVDREEDLPAAEMKWISCYRGMGAPLTNETDGGEGALGCVRSEEFKAKLSKANKGKKLSSEHRARIAESHRGKKMDGEVVERIAEKLRGRETWMKGRKHSIETRAKISATVQGRKLSPEHRAKLSEKLRGRQVSAETRRKIGEAHRGKIVSEKSKARMSEAAFRRYAKERSESVETLEESGQLRLPMIEEGEGE